MACPGPHVFILVITIGRFTAEEQNTVEQIVEIFGERMFRYMLVIFTRKDELDRSKICITEYIKRVPQTLTNILRKCQNRFLAVDNTADAGSKNRMVQDLLRMVDGILVTNNGKYYTNDMFHEAEMILRQRTEKEQRLLRKKKQQEIDAQTDKVKREYLEKIDREVAENLYREQVWEQKEIEKLFRETELQGIEDEIRNVQRDIKARTRSSRMVASYRVHDPLQKRLKELEKDLANLRHNHKMLDERAKCNVQKWQDQEIPNRWKRNIK